jgi:DNA-binding response OmpR family regulator
MEAIVDRDRGCIMLDGCRVNLTRKELALAAYLSERPGFIRSREQIMEQVYDGLFVDDRTVDTLVRRLRAKLRLVVPGFDPIVTRSGFGYSWGE